MAIQAIKQTSNLHFSFPHHPFSCGISASSCVLSDLYYLAIAKGEWVCVLTAVRSLMKFSDREQKVSLYGWKQVWAYCRVDWGEHRPPPSTWSSLAWVPAVPLTGKCYTTHGDYIQRCSRICKIANETANEVTAFHMGFNILISWLYIVANIFQDNFLFIYPFSYSLADSHLPK